MSPRDACGISDNFAGTCSESLNLLTDSVPSLASMEMRSAKAKVSEPPPFMMAPPLYALFRLQFCIGDARKHDRQHKAESNIVELPETLNYA